MSEIEKLINIIEEDTKKEDTKKEESTIEISSAGFNSGNYSEVKINNEIVLDRLSSNRGFNIIVCSDKNYYFNIDFFIKTNSFSANRNFIMLINKIPNNTYFIIAVKDDAQRNLFNSTKNFMYNILHCKHIYDLQYRDSWCALIYKDVSNYIMIDEKYSNFNIATITHNLSIKKTNTIIEKTPSKLDKILEELSDIKELLKKLHKENDTENT
jgi:hypothetical protein